MNIPVLAKRIKGKLLFTLCTRCAELQSFRDVNGKFNNDVCNHSIKERVLKGTYT